MHIEFLVEERSMEAALRNLVPRILTRTATFHIHTFNGKRDLLSKLPDRMRSYSRFLPPDWYIVVLVDNDDDDCQELKGRLEEMADRHDLVTLTRGNGRGSPHVLNRIVIEELESWFLGDIPAVVSAFPNVPSSLGQRRGFRDPDAIPGGTWEALERELKRAGYYPTGMPKIDAARRISEHMDPASNRSRSFQVFREGLCSLLE